MICFLIMIAPLMRGAVHPWAKTVIQMIVLLSAIILLTEKIMLDQFDRSIGSIEKPVILIFMLGLFSFMFSRYKPIAGEGFFMLFIYLAAYLTAVDSIRTRKHQRIIIYMIIGTAIMLSVIGILKRLDMLILPWWRYPDIDHSFNAGAVSGVYVNKNHMAGFLEMAIPFSIVLLFIKSRSRGSILLLVALVLFLLTVQILTLSRGGWVSSAVSLVFLVSVMISTKGRFEKLPFMAGGLCIIVLFLFFIFNSTAVKRASSMTDYEKGLPISGRLHCWKGTVNQIKDNWLSGTGPGTFAQAYPQYQLPGSLYLQRYTHNDYLNFTAETGVFFVPVTAVVLYIVFKTGFNSLHSRSRQKRGLAAASMAGILAILIHSFGDFNLNIPANAFLFVILGAILASTSEMTRTELRHQSDSTILP